MTRKNCGRPRTKPVARSMSQTPMPAEAWASSRNSLPSQSILREAWAFTSAVDTVDPARCSHVSNIHNALLCTALCAGSATLKLCDWAHFWLGRDWDRSHEHDAAPTRRENAADH